MAQLTEKELKRLADIQDRINRGVKIQQKTQEELNGLLAKQRKELDTSLKINKAYAKISSAVKKTEENIDKSLSSRLQNLVKGNITSAIGLSKVKEHEKAQNDLAKETQKNAHSILTSGIKDQDQKLGLLNLSQDISEGLVNDAEVGERINALGLEEGNIKEKLTGEAMSLLENQKGVELSGKAASASTAKWAKRLGFAGAAFAILKQIAQQFAGQIDAIGKQFGSLTELGSDFNKSLLSSSVEATRLGGSIEEVAGITNVLASNFGIGLDAAAEMSAKVFDTAKATGLSADESANLFGVLMQTANLSAVQAERFAEGAFQLARQNQVAPQQVLKDIAGSAETIALFTKDGGNNIMEAAVQARKLGINLDSVGKVSESLLDFETSITKEVEASVLIGRQLNFQRARELSLAGDKVGMMKEVVKQVGSEAQFNKLNEIQRKSIADSISMSVAEMSKLVGQTEQVGIKAKSFRDLLGPEGLSQFTLMMNELKAVSAELVNALGPGLMSIGKLLRSTIGFFRPVIDIINILFNGISFILNKLDPFLDMMGMGTTAGGGLFGGLSNFAKESNQWSVAGGGGAAKSPNPRNSVMASTNRMNTGMGMGGISPAGVSAGTSNVNVRTETVIRGRDIYALGTYHGEEFGGTQLGTAGSKY
tara:strand:+ start:309 stop:2264 length:1956 start_codon:yes stop_codon:yes gene_type:complete